MDHSNDGNADVAALIVAAGESRRMGFDKATAPLCGRPLVTWSLAAFQECAEISSGVLVCSAERIQEFSALAAPYPKFRFVVAGGSKRLDSVLSGLEALAARPPGFVAVHDAARPLVTPALIEAVIKAARKHGAAAAAAPVTDTLNRAHGAGVLVETVSRKSLWAMQTPQVAGYGDLRAALTSPRSETEAVTDEMSALIAAGLRPHAVPHVGLNFKVTFPRDMQLAATLVEQMNPRRPATTQQ